VGFSGAVEVSKEWKVYEMSKTRMVYFENEDILHLSISEEPESGSVELNPNITAELNDRGELIGIEIINASSYIRDSILESVQGKLLNLPGKRAIAK
jgi:uncharacterized protein YuzE